MDQTVCRSQEPIDGISDIAGQLLHRHLDHQVRDLPWGPRPTATPAGGAAVVFPRDQAPVPPKNRIRGDDSCDLRQCPPAEALTANGEATTLGVGQSKRPTTQLLSENPILLPKIVDQIFLVAVHPASGREHEPAPALPTRLTVSLSGGTGLREASSRGLELTPDGRTVVFVGCEGICATPERAQVFRRPLDQLDAEPIAGTQGATWVSVSPDGRTIGFGSVLLDLPAPLRADDRNDDRPHQSVDRKDREDNQYDVCRWAHGMCLLGKTPSYRPPRGSSSLRGLVSDTVCGRLDGGAGAGAPDPAACRNAIPCRRRGARWALVVALLGRVRVTLKSGNNPGAYSGLEGLISRGVLVILVISAHREHRYQAVTVLSGFRRPAMRSAVTVASQEGQSPSVVMPLPRGCASSVLQQSWLLVMVPTYRSNRSPGSRALDQAESHACEPRDDLARKTPVF